MKQFIITYIFSIISIAGLSQLTNNGANLAIQQNAVVSSTMNIENTGKIYNKGIIYASADWTNSNFYDTTGTLILNGQNIQSIEHNGQDFKFLIIDGPGEKILNSDANIINELSLRNGILTVASGNYLVLKQNAISTNSSQSSFVNGPIYNTGTGYKFFPIGKDTQYSPVELDSVANYSVVGMEMFAPNLKLDALDGLTVSDDRYYQQTFLNGSNTNSRILLPYDNRFNSSHFTHLVVVQANPNEMFQSIGNDTLNTIGLNGIKSIRPATKELYTLALRGKIITVLFIPSALSANAPNIEDQVVKIYGDDFSEIDFSFMVFNKWGNLIFSSNSIEFMKNNGWDGTNKNNGKKEPNGMYSYVIKGKDVNGNKIEKTGTIMIIN